MCLVCVLAHMYTYCVHVDARSQWWVSISVSPPPLIFWSRVSQWTWIPLVQLGWLANVSACVNLHHHHHPSPSTGITDMFYHIAPGFYKSLHYSMMDTVKALLLSAWTSFSGPWTLLWVMVNLLVNLPNSFSKTCFLNLVKASLGTLSC